MIQKGERDSDRGGWSISPHRRTLKVFGHHITALESKAAKDTSDVPKVSRSLPIGKWSETFSLFLHDSAIGARNIPLAYVIRETVDVPAEAPALLTGKPYSDEHGSVVNELIARASHTHDLFQEDNKLVFCLLEEALRATSYAASLSPFKGRNRFDGRGAWFALIAQFIGKDKWQKELKKQEDLIHSQCWKSNGNILLETFISKHRQGFVSMQRCAEHIDYQLPNERTRVTYLLDAIKTNDPHLSAAIANVKADDGPAGKRSDFEACAAYLLPSDPVAQKRRSNRREDHNISGAATMDLGETRGKTGVDFRYYEPEEYETLTAEQKDELRTHRQKQKSSGKKGSKRGAGKDQGKGEKSKKLKLSRKDKNDLATQVIAAIEAKVANSEDQNGQTEEQRAQLRDLVIGAFSNDSAPQGSASQGSAPASQGASGTSTGSTTVAAALRSSIGRGAGGR